MQKTIYLRKKWNAKQHTIYEKNEEEMGRAAVHIETPSSGVATADWDNSASNTAENSSHEIVPLFGKSRLVTNKLPEQAAGQAH